MMKRILSFILAGLMMAAVLCGCKKNEKTNSGDSESQKSETKESDAQKSENTDASAWWAASMTSMGRSWSLSVPENG